MRMTGNHSLRRDFGDRIRLDQIPWHSPLDTFDVVRTGATNDDGIGIDRARSIPMF